MADLQDARAKLKSRSPAAQTPNLTVAKALEADQEALAYAKAIADTNVDAWYPYLQDFTMKTFFIPVSKSVAKIFTKRYLFLEKHGEPLTEEENKVLEDLKRDIDEKISSLPPNAKGEKAAFVRCSTRSPKDSHVSISRSRDILIQELNKHLPNHPPTPPSDSSAKLSEIFSPISSNAKLLALLKAALGGMRVFSGKEALDLLCSSERIYEDLNSEFDKKDFHQLIIIREWMDIPVMHEYRGFVNNKKLNAISQYYHTIYFPELPPLWEKNMALINQFFEENLAEKIPLDSYIIDFALAESGTTQNWKEDIAILKSGPFTSRLTQQEWPTTPGIDLAIAELLNSQ